MGVRISCTAMVDPSTLLYFDAPLDNPLSKTLPAHLCCILLLPSPNHYSCYPLQVDIWRLILEGWHLSLHWPSQFRSSNKRASQHVDNTHEPAQRTCTGWMSPLDCALSHTGTCECTKNYSSGALYGKHGSVSIHLKNWMFIIITTQWCCCFDIILWQ